MESRRSSTWILTVALLCVCCAPTTADDDVGADAGVDAGPDRSDSGALDVGATIDAPDVLDVGATIDASDASGSDAGDGGPLCDATSCDDRNACNGVETCDPTAGCQAGPALVCDDANACNGVETCDPTAGCEAGVALVCDDANACNGVEACDPTAGCEAGVAPVCDDANACTIDSCSTTVGCVHAAVPVGSVPACPGTSCRTIHLATPTAPTGAYWIDPDGAGAFQAHCEMTTAGGGWTLVMTIAPADGNSVGYDNQAFWTLDAEYRAFANATTNDYKSPAAHRLSASRVMIDSASVGPGSAVLGWRTWPMTIPRTFDSFFTPGIVAVHATDTCETGPADGVMLGTTSLADDIIRQGTCLHADVNPSPSGQADLIRLTTIPANSMDNMMSGFASCIDCGTAWQGTASPFMGLDRAGCAGSSCTYATVCRAPPVPDCLGNYCTSTYGSAGGLCGVAWNSRIYVQ